MSLENDISCLYAAKHFAPHLQLEQPQQYQQSQFLIKLGEITEKYAKEIFNKVKERGQEFEALEEGTEEQITQSQSIILDLCTEVYCRLEAEITTTYEQQKKVGTITPEEKRAYHEFMAELSPEYVFMMASGIGEQEAREHIDEAGKETQQKLDEWGKEQDKKFEAYLATAGINTPEGKAAFQIANSAAHQFSKRIYYKDEYEQQDSVKKPTTGRRRPSIETKMSQAELEGMVHPAIYSGLLSANQYAIMSKENQDALHETATRWLTKEINERLTKGLEFNLLDAVSVKKESDGQIQLTIDKRQHY